MAEHFVQPPRWEWYILAYFFFGGLAAGCYILATMLRLWGGREDQAVARIGYLIAFPLVLICPILLTIDLGKPLRFYHMLFSTTPGAPGLMFKPWSPMSLGTWALLLFGIFSFVSFVEALTPRVSARRRKGRGPTTLRFIIDILGGILGLYVASYTGVLLSVSNQPVWSDTWALGGLFLASALSGSAALLAWIARRRGAEITEMRLAGADRYFALLELLMLAIFFWNLAGAGTLSRTLTGPWLVAWLLVLVCLLPPLLGAYRWGRPVVAGRPALLLPLGTTTLAAAVVLAGVLLMRFVVIFSAQL
jgi:formate-dependent nitrite reductase membrane component NrfD